MFSEDRETEVQIDNEHPVWRAMSRLFPEVLDAHWPELEEVLVADDGHKGDVDL